ncbi:MAG: hypothetical protein MEQ07_08905 [Aquimonas sp.]|nr:hypothetical protein [Aquimonas sp.]
MSRLAWIVLLALALVLAALGARQWSDVDQPLASPSPAGSESPSSTLVSTDGDGAASSMSELAPASSVSEFQQDLLKMPEEVQQALLSLQEQFDSGDWASQPVLANLERWRLEAEQAPKAAASLARALRRCARPRFSSVQDAQREWQSQLARLASSDLSPERNAEWRGQEALRLAAGLADLANCEGFTREEARREYMRWLERAARELQPSDERARLRLSYIEAPFLDLPRSADRVGAIDEVIRRRDIARAWLHELREDGERRAFDLSHSAYAEWGELEAVDSAEALAWSFVHEVAGAVRAAGIEPNSERLARAAERWEIGPSRTRPEDAPYLEEGIRRGREHYLRIFGAPPG